MPAETRRPSAWWFLPASLLVVVGLFLVVVPITHSVVRLFHTDGTLPVDGQLHLVALGDQHDHYIWFPVTAQPGAGCHALDGTSRAPIPLHPPDAVVTRQLGGTKQVAAYRFTPTSGSVLIACSQPSPTPIIDVQVGPAVGGKPGAGTVLGFLVGAAGILAGLVWGVVLVILFVVRRPREPAWTPPTPPAPPAPPPT
jgi:hypothetical protein